METPPPQAGQVQSAGMQGADAVSGAKVAPETKRKIYYGIAAFLLFSLSGLLGYFVSGGPTELYFFFIFFFTGFGALHIYLMKWLRLFGSDKTFASRVLYSIIIVLLSMIGFFVAFYFLSHKSGFSLYFTLEVWYFMVPMAIARCFDLALAVPPREYKQWYYPAKPIVVDTDKIDKSNFAIVTFVFAKKEGDKEKSNFQSRAPYDYLLGDLFYAFIQEWNYRNPQATIQFLDDDKVAFGFLFYVQDKWYQSKKFLDPEKTIRNNEINVNQIIQTLRIPQSNPAKTT